MGAPEGCGINTIIFMAAGKARVHFEDRSLLGAQRVVQFDVEVNMALPAPQYVTALHLTRHVRILLPPVPLDVFLNWSSNQLGCYGNAGSCMRRCYCQTVSSYAGWGRGLKHTACRSGSTSQAAARCGSALGPTLSGAPTCRGLQTAAGRQSPVSQSGKRHRCAGPMQPLHMNCIACLPVLHSTDWRPLEQNWQRMTVADSCRPSEPQQLSSS